uniref:Uncharacterized protein n=1 Tax=Solanum lycopersicum TaxID=4081 RepID=A0A3Q7ID61_SOLLC
MSIDGLGHIKFLIDRADEEGQEKFRYFFNKSHACGAGWGAGCGFGINAKITKLLL